MGNEYKSFDTGGRPESKMYEVDGVVNRFVNRERMDSRMAMLAEFEKGQMDKQLIDSLRGQLVSEKNLEIRYRGWCCHYSTPDRFADRKRIACNRNGHYRVFAAEGKKALALKIMIYPERAV